MLDFLGVVVLAAVLAGTLLAARLMGVWGGASTAPTPAPAEAPKPKPKPSRGKRPHRAPPASQHKRKVKAADVSDPLLVATLKGHTDGVTSLAYSPCGTFLATSSADRSIRLWRCKSFAGNPQFTRTPVELDSATAVGFSPDGDVLAAVTLGRRRLLVYGVGKEDGRLALRGEFPTAHREDVHTVVVGAGAAFFVTCAGGTETKMRVHAADGSEVAVVDTHALTNHDLAVSPDGLRLAVGAMLGDVRVYEAAFDKKTRRFERLEHAMDLKGHRKGVPGLAFASDSRAVLTASLDGRLRVWNTDVRHRDGEDPRVVCETALPDGVEPGRAAFQPAGGAAAVALDGGLGFYDVIGDRQTGTVPVAHSSGGVRRVVFAPNGKVVATSGGDRFVRVWRVPA